MTDIKSVLSLLCQHLNLSIKVAMKPEYFRLAKFNGTAENVTDSFWKALNLLSYYAIREKRIQVDFQDYDTIWTTKLYFACLQYPAIEFYALSKDSKNHRQLLLAFAWLLGTQHVLSVIVRVNLGNSVLGRECSYSDTSDKEEIKEDVPESLIAQMNNILHLSSRVNYNIKEISELVSEKAKLVSKVHTASINVSGLPHLSVSELALIKRIATGNNKAPSEEDQKYLKQLSAIGNLLDVHMKWLKKEHVFYEWMVTVVEEHNKSLSSTLNNINWNEVLKFIALLRHLIEEKFKALSSKEESDDCQVQKFECVSRFLRTQSNGTEIDTWLMEMSIKLEEEMKDLSKRKEKLSEELKEILQLIPSCIQV